MPLEIQNREIAVRFIPPNADAFIIMGVYSPASGSTTIKRNFIDQVFKTRSALQNQHNCNIIVGGDFNSTVGHLERNMKDYNNKFSVPDKLARDISIQHVKVWIHTSF